MVILTFGGQMPPGGQQELPKGGDVGLVKLGWGPINQELHMGM